MMNSGRQRHLSGLIRMALCLSFGLLASQAAAQTSSQSGPSVGAVAIDGAKLAKSVPNAKSAKSGRRKPNRPNLIYKEVGDRELHLDIYYPAHQSEAKQLAWPTIVWIHGGGWHKGSKDKCPIIWLCEHGYAVASVEYRLTDEARWPSQLQDCRAAVQHLRERASEYGLNAARIGACGGSAGGHLVATMATVDLGDSEQKQRVQAVCDFYGPTDLLTMPNNVVSSEKTREQLASVPGAKLLGGIVSEQLDKAKAASPWWQASTGDVPMMIVHGDADEQVPLVQSQRLHEKLQSLEVASELLVVPGAGHGMKHFSSEDVRAKIVKFFDRYLKR
ncbi:MAG: alpha/beta hydrolase fold domain-containing protein [Aureliella sp.]